MKPMKRKYSHYFSVPTLGIFITLIIALIGELYRLKGLLLLDIWTPIFTGSWLLWKYKQGKIPTASKLHLAAIMFAALAFISLLVNSGEMSKGEFIAAAMYGIRWTSLILLAFLIMDENPEIKKIIQLELLIFSCMLAIAGFIQLTIMPDFSQFEILGWDPHQGRLLSTWFDPNFVGAYLAFSLPVFMGIAWDSKKYPALWLLILGLMALALLLTLSRSAYLAGIVGMGIFALIRSRKLFIFLIIATLLSLTILSPVRERSISLVQSIIDSTSESYFLPDPSARLRFNSWEEAWRLFLDKPLLGQGYNRYAEAALKLGSLKDTKIHSANGSDSSLLTILATTGVLGFLPFISLYAMILRKAWWTWSHHNKSSALGLFTGITGLFIHSIFVNSLLFPLLLAPFWISVGSVLPDKVKIR